MVRCQCLEERERTRDTCTKPAGLQAANSWLSPTGPQLLIGGAAVLVSVDELFLGLDAFEALAGAVSSAITSVSLVLFEPVPSPTGGPPDALFVVLSLPVVPDWLALPAFCTLVVFGGLVEAGDAVVAFDAVLLLMVLSPADTLLLVGETAVLVSVDELFPARDAFEAFAGAVSSAITSVSLVLFEPVPSPMGGGPLKGPGGADALLVPLPLSVVSD